MAPLATLSIDLEGTAIGLRPPSQGTNQALPGHAEIFGRLYPNVNLVRAPQPVLQVGVTTGKRTSHKPQIGRS